MKYKLLQGTINDKYFVITIYDQKEITKHLKLGLKRFFQVYKSSKLKEKIKKESDHGYFAIDSKRT